MTRSRLMSVWARKGKEEKKKKMKPKKSLGQQDIPSDSDNEHRKWSPLES